MGLIVNVLHNLHDFCIFKLSYSGDLGPAVSKVTSADTFTLSAFTWKMWARRVICSSTDEM